MNRFVRQRSKTRRRNVMATIGAQPPHFDKLIRLLPCLLACLMVACTQEGPDARLRATMAAMEAAIEARRPADFVEYVSEDFVGGSERIDRRMLRGFLGSQMLGNDRIEVLLGSPEITLHGDRATVTVSATVIGGRFFPERGEQVRIVSGWQLEEGQWRCYTAEWERS